jgi:hypothetical protein
MDAYGCNAANQTMTVRWTGVSPEVPGPVGELVVQQGAGVLVGAATQVAGIGPLV